MKSQSEDHPNHPLFARAYDPLTNWVERRVFDRHRRHLASNLEGAVLDIGAGTGAMFEHFAASPDQESSVSFYAIEPDPHMCRRAHARASELDLDVSIRQAGAESLPYEDDSFDVVIAALVFCTIPDVEAALEEIARVLKPDGELRYFEHVRDTGWRSTVQEILNPLWNRAVGGCNLDRETTATLATSEHVEIVHYERLRIGYVPVNPFIRGVAHPR